MSAYGGVADYISRLEKEVVDLKAEVVRLRAQKVELTAHEESAREGLRSWLATSAEEHDYPKTRDVLAALVRVCPPKRAQTNEALADLLDDFNRRMGYNEHSTVAAVAKALRARGDK